MRVVALFDINGPPKCEAYLAFLGASMPGNAVLGGQKLATEPPVFCQ
jgi:hypothetical protein